MSTREGQGFYSSLTEREGKRERGQTLNLHVLSLSHGVTATSLVGVCNGHIRMHFRELSQTQPVFMEKSSDQPASRHLPPRSLFGLHNFKEAGLRRDVAWS